RAPSLLLRRSPCSTLFPYTTLFRSVPPGPFSGDGEIPVFVVNHGWHTGVMVDAASAQQQIPQLAQRFPGLAWLEFGWGNRDFYEDRKSTRLNSSHVKISYAVFCLKK